MSAAMGTVTHSAFNSCRRITALLRGDWRDVWVIIVYAIGVGLCSLAFPIAVNSLVSNVAFGTVTQPVVVLTLIVGAVLAFSGAMRVAQLYAVELLQRRLITRLGLTFAAKIPHIHQQRFAKKYGPEYVLRFFEVFQVQKGLAVLLLDGTGMMFQLVLGLTLVSFYHPVFLLFALILFSVVIVVFSLLGIGGVRRAVEESDAKYDVVAWLQDLASSPTMFKSYAGESLATSVGDSLIYKYLKKRSRHFHLIAAQFIAALLLQTIASSALLGVGGYLVIEGQLTLGQLVAAEIVFSTVLLSVAKMSKHIEIFYDLAAGVAKLDGILDLPFEDLDGAMMGIREDAASLSFEHISLKSMRDGSTVLNDMSLKVEAGNKVAIWGENASGKTYLASLAFRLKEPASGIVRLDEYNITTIHPKEVREEVALITDIELFHGSILSNLTLKRSGLSELDIRKALDLVGLTDDLYSLPEGLATRLRGTPFPLSRGQTLRLMVARGILAKPRLLILDGTLDSIDEPSREQVLTSLFSPACPWTTLVFTHDEDVLRQFPLQHRIIQGKITGANS